MSTGYDPSPTAVALAASIRRRDVSPVEVVDAAIDRITRRGPSLNAFVYEGFDDARAAAREAEAAVMRGGPLGPMHGVPTAIKDLFDFKPGWVSTFGGIRALRDWRPGFHCAYAERVERAGAIIVGKTNSPVMGFRGTCDNPLFGPTRNPFDTTKNSGGSSGGTAAAVADGLLPVAEGSDGGGSIRIPAAWCNVFGYQPSYGRVPFLARPNGFGGTAPFVYEGPIARTVEDAALAMTAIGGFDPRDPFSLPGDVDYLGATRRSIVGMRIAYSPDLGTFPVDARIRAVVEDAVRAFEAAGAHVEEVEVDLPRDQRELSDLWCRLIMPLNQEALAGLGAFGFDVLGEHRDDLPPEYLRWIDATANYTITDVSRDHQLRTGVFDALQAIMADYDLLVCPTVAAMPVDNAGDGNTVGPAEIAGVEVDPLIGWCLTYFTNMTGQPAASVPAGFADGLPVGMQIIGRRHADEAVLAASAVYERLRPWHEAYQRLADRPLEPADGVRT